MAAASLPYTSRILSPERAPIDPNEQLGPRRGLLGSRCSSECCTSSML
jgi:hypothetical protein